MSQSRKKLNIKAKNVPSALKNDLYHHLLNASWLRFFIYYALSFLLINLVFATLYFINREGLGSSKESLTFFETFAFSVQTFSTVGYGAIYPNSSINHSIVVIQSMLGLLSTAIMTGLLFAKFSKPTAKIVFSKPLLITTFNDKKVLMFRVANARSNNVLSAQLSLSYTYVMMTKEGSPFRRFEKLKLERDSSPLFSLSWTVMHPIDQDSPFYNKSSADLARDKVEIYAHINGIDETFNQSIHEIHRYLPEDIHHNRQFVDVIQTAENGQRFIDYMHFHDLK